jgi:hypothetical protein
MQNAKCKMPNAKCILHWAFCIDFIRVLISRYKAISPRRTARRTISVRLAAPSFPEIEDT